jgi:YD repeat-containing protein
MKRSIDHNAFMSLIHMITLAVFLVWTPASQGADIVREPMHGYWVGYEGGRYVNTLFQNWKDAAKSVCGENSEFEKFTSAPAEHIPFSLYCDNTSIGWRGIYYWMDACPGWETPYVHEASRRCSEAGEKPPCKCDRYGNPISMSTQSKVQVEEDYKPKHLLKFSRYYSSNKTGAVPNAMSSVWRHSYSWSLSSILLSSSGTTVFKAPDYRLIGRNWYPMVSPRETESSVDIIGPDAYGYHFVSTDGGMTWSADADIVAKLAVTARDANNVPVQWELKDEEQNSLLFDAGGRLVSKRILIGGELDFTYSDATTPQNIAPVPGLLIGVNDNYGHKISFAYDEKSRMTKFMNAAFEEYIYDYDTEDNLISVTYPDGLKRLYHYDEAQNNPQQNLSIYRHLLTGISEELSPGVIQRLSTYKYSSGKAISTENSGGVNRYIFDYYNSKVTDPLGATWGDFYERQLGRLVPSAKAQPRIGSNSTDTFSYYYDVEGNVKQTYDFNGAHTCYQYELGRRLESKRVEGLGTYDSCVDMLPATGLPTGARKITTVWHSVLRQPITIVQPKLREDFTYDSAGRVLTKTLSATNDANGALGLNATLTGAPRVFTYTYDANGHVLTLHDPRIDVDATTVYDYDASGNLTMISNAAKHVTQLSNYDAHGRPGKIVDPNGLITNITYTWRGAPATVTVGGETTSYSYDGAGKLLQIVYPTGATLTYTYDAAGRQIGISDSNGNSIAYALDPMGNRTSEQVRDSAGMLARQIGRSYDLLNRLKQVTGAKQ